MTCDGMIRAEIWADINANTSNGREGTKWTGKQGRDKDKYKEKDRDTQREKEMEKG